MENRKDKKCFVKHARNEPRDMEINKAYERACMKANCLRRFLKQGYIAIYHVLQICVIYNIW